MTANTPDVFGTAAILFHSFVNPFSRWARDFAEHQMPPILHFHNAWLSGAYMPIKVPKVVSVVTYHGIQGERALRVQPLRRRLHSSWAHRLATHGTHHVSVDRQNTAIAQKLFGLDPSLFTVIPNGTAGIESQTGCPRLADPSRPFTVGHVGTLDDGKGWDITADAVRSLHEQGHPVRYLIAGSGARVAEAAEWCRQNPQIATYLGHNPRPMIEVFPLLDALSIPSKSEGLPMAVLEAFSLGIPVVATRVGGLPEAIEDTRNGFLVERRSDAVADALRLLIMDSARHSAMSQAARKSHRERYSASAMGEAYDRLYRAVC
jgi:glycosyltransferase involved in cell wall biosynthesis